MSLLDVVRIFSKFTYRYAVFITNLWAVFA